MFIHPLTRLRLVLDSLSVSSLLSLGTDTALPVIKSHLRVLFSSIFNPSQLP